MAPVVSILKNGGIGILPTDTLYGLVGPALNPGAVERIFKVKERNPDKPLVVLIAGVDDLKLFRVAVSEKDKRFLDTIWPGPVSVILRCPDKTYSYLHRGTNSIAFRLPASNSLRHMIEQTGPLVAPSANPEGKPPATTIDEAKAYFGNTVDFYEDGGTLMHEPSTLVDLLQFPPKILRGTIQIAFKE